MNANRWFVVPVIVSFVAVLTLLAAQNPNKKRVLPPPRYTISGRITGLAPSHHARVVATSANKPSHTATTRDDGSYTLQAVLRGSYSVRPSRSGYRFSPTFRTVAVTTVDRQEIDFVAHPLPPKKNR